MAMPLLDFITGRARQALPFLRAAAVRGDTPSAALASLKPLDLTFNRQRMLDVYAALQNRLDVARTLRLVGSSTPIPAELHDIAASNINSNYQYIVGAYSEEGIPLGFLTVASSETLTRGEIEERAGILFATQTELYIEDEQIPIAGLRIVELNRKG